MGMGLPRVIVTETDLSQYVDTLVKGVSCVAGITEKGPIGKPQLISSEMQFERVFGGELKTSDFPLLAKRALSYGAALWVSRVAHYTDVTKANTLTAKSATVTLRDRAARDTLKVTASSPGTWGNNLKVIVSESELDPDHLFSLTVLEGGEEVATMADVSMDDDSEYYIEKQKSAYLSFEDLASTSGPDVDRPALGTFALSGGDDGVTGISDADYIGSAASGTGLYAFDEVNDALQLAIPGVTSPAVVSAGLAYCENRKDLLFVTETPFDLSPQEAVDFRLGKGSYTHAPFNSSYGAMYYPKLRIYDVARQKERLVSPVGDVLGVMAINDYLANESYVPAGSRRGRLLNALGVDVNVGGRGRLGEGNYICENQLNPLCVFDDMGSVVWGAQTLQRQASLLREVNVRRLMIVVEKTVAAYARAYVHQPDDPRTWREFYRGLEPKFREWKAARWFYDYRIFCDQDAQSLDEAKLNIPESVQRGEFKCQIFVKPVVGIKCIIIDAAITRLDADFAESEKDILGLAA
ncbi:MAG: hypothetical protein IJU98_08075 [Synergistaceae bacterium]|nr:hypothetical protein [Synergistaceae bacterium]